MKEVALFGIEINSSFDYLHLPIHIPPKQSCFNHQPQHIISAAMDFDRLPLEMRQHILNFLPVRELLQAALVCRAWNVLVGTLIPQRNVAIRLHAGVDPHLLASSVRKYNSVVVYLVEERSTRDMEKVYELVDLFTKKFELTKWCIKVGSSSKLIECYETFEEVFSKLTELQICFLPFQPIDPRDSLTPFYELQLEDLQVLHWEEPQVCAYYSRMLNQNNTQFDVFAPKLQRAKILFKENSLKFEESSGSESVVLYDCEKLTSLEVRLCDKPLDTIMTQNLESIRELKIVDANRPGLDWNGMFKLLKTLKRLKIHRCHKDVIAASLKHAKFLEFCEIITIEGNDPISQIAKITSNWKHLTKLTITEDKGVRTGEVLYEPW